MTLVLSSENKGFANNSELRLQEVEAEDKLEMKSGMERVEVEK